MYIRMRSDICLLSCTHDEEVGENAIEVEFKKGQVFLAECLDLQDDRACFRLSGLGVVVIPHDHWEVFTGKICFGEHGWSA